MKEIQTDFITQKTRICVALSGGLDSSVLLNFLAQLQQDRSFILEAVHVNYKLRGEDSDQDQKHAEALCDSHQIPLSVTVVPQSSATEVAKQKSGVQQWAREIRLEVFSHKIKDGFVIALAHHLDDVAENCILRLSKGQNWRKLAGMSVLHHQYWRPFLNLPKTQLEDYAKAHRVQYRQDLSNEETKYERNFVRLKILPVLRQLNHRSSEHLAQFSMEIQECMSALHKTFETQYQFAQGVQVKSLEHLSDVLRREILAAFFAYAGISYGSRNTIDSLIRNMEGQQWESLKQLQISPEWYVLSINGRIALKSAVPKPHG